MICPCIFFNTKTTVIKKPGTRAPGKISALVYFCKELSKVQCVAFRISLFTKILFLEKSFIRDVSQGSIYASFLLTQKLLFAL